MAAICTRLSGSIQWHHTPDDTWKKPCESLLRTLMHTPEQVLSDENLCTVAKLSYRKLVLRQVVDSWQLYYKVYLPDISLKWRRGLPFMRLPALREACLLTELTSCGIGAVPVIGTAQLPWKRFRFAAPISVLITASQSHIRKLKHPSNISLLDEPHKRMAIALKIISYADMLHKKGYGNLDMHPHNILFNPETTDILLCDLERLSKLQPWSRQKRISQDYRKIFKAVSLLLDDTLHMPG